MHDCSSGEALTPLQTALDHYARLQPLAPVSKPLADADGEVLAAPVSAACDLPAFTQSAMDGYALRHVDLAAALQLVGEVAAGTRFPRGLQAGEAVRIFTGAALPAGADTVARQEIVQLGNDKRLHINEPLDKGQDVRRQAEELHRGQRLLDAGQRLTPGRVAALAMAGVRRVQTRPRVRVAVIITGNEVQQPGDSLTPGRVHDANGPLLRSWLAQRGQAMQQLLWAGDDLDTLTRVLTQAAGDADLIITTGGASVGRYDFLPQAATQAGFACQFHKVAQRPGKPLWFGHREGCVLLALPGNPAAVLAGLYVHAAAIIHHLEGEAGPTGWQQARLHSPLTAHPSIALLRRMRQHQDGAGRLWLSPLPHQASHMLSNLAQANALAWLPVGAGTLGRGTVLQFLSVG